MKTYNINPNRGDKREYEVFFLKPCVTENCKKPVVILLLRYSSRYTPTEICFCQECYEKMIHDEFIVPEYSEDE